MEKIKLQVWGSQIQAVERPAVITAGTVGLEAEFTFDSQWDGLAKTAVFRAGDQMIATALEQDTHQIPWEVLEKPNLWLCIGVFGANAEGTVVIPTVWAQVAVVHTGVDPEGDPAMDPTVPAWQEALTRLDSITPELNNHINNAGGYNPHGVTCEQIDAVSQEEYERFFENVTGRVSANELEIGDIRTSINEHIINLHGDNPHGVTCEQIGAADKKMFETFMNSMESNSADLDLRVLETELICESSNYHLASRNNPHGVTCEQIGAATKEDVEATKAIIVTVSEGTPSHTNEQIFNTVVNGGAVYLKMWSGTYIRLSWCTSTEALFEASLINAVTGADGNAYPVQNFRTYRIVNDKYLANSAIVPSQAYVDAMIQHYLNQ